MPETLDLSKVKWDAPQANGIDLSQVKWDTATPSDANLGDAQWGAEHPYLRALQNTASQSMLNPLTQAANALVPAVRGIERGIGMAPGAQPIQGPDMSNAPFAAKVAGDVAGGAAKGVTATLAGGGNPFAGYGALSGLEAYGNNQAIVPAIAKGVVSAVPQMVAGAAGSKIAQAVAKPLGGAFSQFAPNVGTALGMGAASAAQAPQGEKLRGFATGAAFGAMSPMGGPKNMTQEAYDAKLENDAGVYRQVLAPSKGEVNKVEIKSGKNLDDFYKLAAQEGLTIEKSSDNKLDTTSARGQLQGRTTELNTQLNEALQKNPDKWFNLEDIGAQAKSKLRDSMKNDSEYEAAANQVDKYINAAVDARGQYVRAPELNDFKQGMWQTSYDPLSPNNNKTARIVGFVAKDKIEKAFPQEDVKGINETLGKYLTLDSLLENAQGRVVQKGKIGKYVAQGVGMLTGHSTGIPGAEMLGSWIGGKASDLMNDPKRITGGIAKTKARINIKTQPSLIGSINPIQSMPKNNVSKIIPALAIGAGSALSMNPIQAQAATIGQKNKNPINLKAFQKWDGMSGKDRFGHAQFKDLDHGIRASLKNLKTHQRNNPSQSLDAYLNTFAEANGSKEAQFIAQKMGVSPKASLASLNMDNLLIHLAQFESKTTLTPKDIQRVKQKFGLS